MDCCEKEASASEPILNSCPFWGFFGGFRVKNKRSGGCGLGAQCSRDRNFENNATVFLVEEVEAIDCAECLLFSPFHSGRQIYFW